MSPIVGGAEDHRRHELGDPFHEHRIQRPLYIDTGRRGAVLTGVDQRTGHRTLCGGLEVGVVEDDGGGLPAELEMQPSTRHR